MQTRHFQKNSEEWLEARKGKITGSKLGDIVVKRGTGKKLGFYELIADRLAIEDDSEDPQERGHRCEPVALQLFQQEMGIEYIDTEQFWISDDNEDIAISPDGVIDVETAVEVKCLSAAKHLQAYFEHKVPSEYEFQVLQYFIVNERLETLYFVFYDPRVTAKPLHWIEIHRDELEGEI